MTEITVGVLTVSDRCARNETVDESGPNLVDMIKAGIIGSAKVVKSGLVPDEKDEIQKVLKEWCDLKIHVILTTGGTGVAKRDVTPEATVSLLEKEIPGISHLIFKESSQLTPLAALSRAVAGVRGTSLIINLPGSKKASKECLLAVAGVVPHAVHLINGFDGDVASVHLEPPKRESKVTAGNAANRLRSSPYPCISVTEAQKIILDKVYLLRKEKMMPFDEALGFVLTQDMVARDDLPPLDVSIKDGYAVLSSDEFPDREVIGYSNAGSLEALSLTVKSGVCVRVNTGAPIPPGADAVVQVENTEMILLSEDGKEERNIAVKVFPGKGEDIRKKGSEYKAGDLLLPSRSRLDAAAVGLAAAAGVTFVRAFDKPVTAIFSTGDELVDPCEKPVSGKVRDSNRATLISLLKEENFPFVDLGIVPDKPDSLYGSLVRAFETADVVVTTGSLSMGDRDYLKQVLVTDFGAEISFGRVLMKPGKPTSFAVVPFGEKMKFWFGLPGNPASAAVTTHLFLLPALRSISGQTKPLPMAVSVPNPGIKSEDRPHYVRGVLSWCLSSRAWHVKVIDDQRSSRIQSCVNANCLVEVPQTGARTLSSLRALIIGPRFHLTEFN